MSGGAWESRDCRHAPLALGGRVPELRRRRARSAGARARVGGRGCHPACPLPPCRSVLDSKESNLRAALQELESERGKERALQSRLEEAQLQHLQREGQSSKTLEVPGPRAGGRRVAGGGRPRPGKQQHLRGDRAAREPSVSGGEWPTSSCEDSTSSRRPGSSSRDGAGAQGCGSEAGGGPGAGVRPRMPPREECSVPTEP